MRRTPLIPVAVAAATLLATAFPTAAQAADPEVVADGLVSPLSVAVAEDGTVFVAQNFASLITKVGEPDPIYADEGGREIGAFSVVGDVLTFGASIPGVDVKMYTYTPAEGGGYDQDEIADLWAFEKANNPDHVNTYGISGLSKKCTKDTPKYLRPYKGKKDAHAYASTTLDGVTYVADAGANAILAIDGDVVSTLAVLPPTKVKITKKVRKNLDAPKCVEGKTFRSEPVPTDVEVGPEGDLHVTTLGGGLGESMPIGGLYNLTTTGDLTRVFGDLMSPTGLAFAPDGKAYVSLLFAPPGLDELPTAVGRVLEISPEGERSPFAEIPFPGDVDYANGSLFVTESGLTDEPGAPPSGKVWEFPLDLG